MHSHRARILICIVTILVIIGAQAGCTQRRAQSFMKQAHTLYGLGRYDEAIAYFQKAAELSPTDVKPLSGLGRCYAAKGDYKAALEQFRAAVARDASARDEHASNLAVLQRAGQHEAALELEKALRSDPASRDMTFPAATGPEKAPAPHAAPAGWKTLWKRAALHELIERKDTFRSEEGLAETLVLAAALTGNLAALDEVGPTLPETSPMRPFFSALKEKDVKAVVTAVHNWEESVEWRKILRECAFGYALAAAGARSTAIEVYSKALKTWPEQNVPIYGIAQVFASANMPRLAARCLQNLLAKTGDNLPVQRLLFELLNRAGLTDDAQAIAEAMFMVAPDDPANVSALAQVYVDRNETDLGVTVLRRGLEKVPGNVELTVAMASALLRGGRPAEALETVNSLPADHARTPQAVRLAAFSLALLGNWAEVAGRCGDVAWLPNDAPLQLLVCAAQANEGRLLDSRQGLQRLAEKAPGCLPDVSVEEAARSVLDVPDSALPQLLKGWAFYYASLYSAAYEGLSTAGLQSDSPLLLRPLFTCIARGLPEEARRAEAERLAGAYAHLPEAWLGVAAVLQTVNDLDGERAALERAVQLAPDSNDVLRARAAFFDRIGEGAALVATLQLLAAQNPEDMAINNNLAYALLMNNGSPQEALKSAQQAAKLAGLNASVLHTLGLAQFRNGHYEESRKTLWQALTLRPLDPTLLLDYGQALMALDRAEDGRKQIQLAVQLTDQLGLEFPRRAEAERLVRGT